ncbi:PrsW family intramembrane metalloprotease [Plantibacter sp. Mn2098]|uniref:PrsW family intramembrane metalloprotease n=1 Tax=Plantibacter sp. Mn2098 TaxID=3395266 RepID=UPI003BE82C76
MTTPPPEPPQHQPQQPRQHEPQQPRQQPQPVFAPGQVYGPAATEAPARVHARHAAIPHTVPSRSISVSAVLAWVALGVLVLVGLAVGAYFVSALGTGGLAIGFVLALIPLAIVLLAVRWIDRWEPEPRLALVLAFLWGATASVAIALVVDLTVQVSVLLVGVQPSDVLQYGVQAPVVEELAKGIGLLILFYAARSQFDGPVDGLVYGAVIAAGFAFSENIQYFGLALADGGGGLLAQTFILRGIVSPFAHVTFTACTGLALGFAARRHRGVAALGPFFAGLGVAVFLHALWNLLPGWFAFPAVYVLLEVPIFALWIGVIVMLRRAEIRVTADRLAEYAAGGWFTPGEVAMISTGDGRRGAKAWARSTSRVAERAMQRFIVEATRLAFCRQRILAGRDRAADRRRETELLESITALRRQLLAGR